jgi:hypothetical protein
MTRLYTLGADDEAVACDDFYAWVRWFEDSGAERQLHRARPAQGVTVSTVFTGFDLAFQNQGPPLLWETRIFGGPYDCYVEAATTREEATRTHDRIVKAIFHGEDPTNGNTY